MSKRWMLVLVLVLSSLLFAGSVAMAQEPKIDLIMNTSLDKIIVPQGGTVDRRIGWFEQPLVGSFPSSDHADINSALEVSFSVQGVTVTETRIDEKRGLYATFDVDADAQLGSATLTITIPETTGSSGNQYAAFTQNITFSIVAAERVVTYTPPEEVEVETIELSPGEELYLYHEVDIGTVQVNGGALSGDDLMFIEIVGHCDALTIIEADISGNGNWIALRDLKARPDAVVGDTYNLTLSSRIWEGEDTTGYAYTHFDEESDQVAAKIQIVAPSVDLRWTPATDVSLPIGQVSQSVRIGQLLVGGTDSIPEENILAVEETLRAYDQDSWLDIDNLRIVDGQNIHADIEVPDDAPIGPYTLEVYSSRRVPVADTHMTYTNVFGTVTVSTRVGVTGVTLNKNTTSITYGASETLTATVAPADATDKSVTWRSSDETVVTVVDGVVSTVGVGDATITVETVDGAFTATCAVTVNKATPEALVWPTASSITYGVALSQSNLTGGSVTGTWAWTTPAAIPTVNNSGYSVTFTPTDAANYDWSGEAGWNGSVVISTVSLDVAKANAPTGVDRTYSVAGGHADRYSFDLAALLPSIQLPRTLGATTYTVVSVSNTDGVLATEPSGVITYPLALDVANVAGDGKTASIVVQVSSENYLDFQATITVETVDKAPVTIDATVINGVYNGSPYAYADAEVVDAVTHQPISDLTPDALYVSTDGKGYSDAHAPTNVGAYKLTLSILDDDYVGSVDLYFGITPKTVTVRADDKTVMQGAALPAPTVTYAGFIGTDSESNALDANAVAKFNVANANAVGTSTIDFASHAVLNDTNGANYALDHQNGTLTVSAPPSPPVTPAEPAETEDEKAVAAAVEAINQLNVSLKATSAPSPSGAMAALLKMLNEALAPSGVTITESDVKITDFTMPSADGDGGFTYTVDLKIGDATGTITGSAVIPYTPSTPSETGVTATAESGSYDNEKPKAKHREIFAFADGKVQFDVGDAVVTKWKSSKPKVVKIDPVTGEATFLKRGTDVVITAILSDGTKLTKRINVVNMASELKLQWKKGDKWVDFSKESPRVVLGKKLTVRVTPVVPGPKAKMFDYDWTMGEPGVADKNAKETRSIVLTGKAEGQTTVTVTLFNGVTVTENVDVVLTKSPDSDAIEEIDETEVADVIDEMEEDLEIEE